MPTSSFRLLLLFPAALCACAVSPGPRHETTPEDRTIFTQIPAEGPAEQPSGQDAAEVAGEETPAGPIEEPTNDEPSCAAEPVEPGPAHQIAVFRRWFRDQAVGRDVTTEDFEPVCGDRAGFLVIHLTVSGPAGGLQSMSRALEAYYPGSSWSAANHERLEGEDYPLRIRAEILVPAGEGPRPRCEWDPELECD